MINVELTRQTHVSEYEFATGTSIVTEGQALVAEYDTNGKVRVKISTGAATERFLGLAISTLTRMTRRPYRETVTVPAGTGNTDRTVTMSKTPIQASVRIEANGGSLDATPTETPAANGDWDVDGTTFTARSATTGAFTVTLVYEYAPTVTEILNAQGDLEPTGTHVSEHVNGTGCLDEGVVYTDFWDTNEDWSDAVGVKAGAGGYFEPLTQAEMMSDVEAIQNITVIQRPVGESLFLGLRLS